jgi:hypothetical protein
MTQLAIATATTYQPPADLATMTTQELRAAMTAAMARTVEQLARLAWIVRILEERGEDLTDPRIGLMPYLRQIAYGQTLPEVVIRYAERPALVKAISALPRPDQQRLASGEPVPLAIRREDGTVEQRMVDPSHLVGEQVGRVFARDRIRTIDEQVIMIEARAYSSPRDPTLTAAGITVDRKRRGLVIGRRFVPVAAVVEALGALAETDDSTADQEHDDNRTAQLNLMLTPDEYTRIREAAHVGHSKMSRVARQALRVAGLI